MPFFPLCSGVGMGVMPIVDAHAHLQDPRLGKDLAGVMARARIVGVCAVAVCGTREADWQEVLDLAREDSGIVPMLGLHPWYVKQALPAWERRLGDALGRSGAGLGECGLDFAVEDGDPTAQESAFRAQVRLARELDRPLSIHCRKAWERLLSIVREEGLPESGAMIHSFSGSAEMVSELQKLGFHLSFSCSITNPTNRKAAKVLPTVRPDRLLLESDAPDLPPRHLEGWDPDAPNEPANVRLVAEAAARLRGEPLERTLELAFANSRRFFGRWLR